MKLKKCACIETLYTELPFLKRIEAARKDGFDSIEFWSWHDKELEAVRQATQQAKITVLGFNGDAPCSIADGGHREEYLQFFEQSIVAARKVGAKALFLHADATGASDTTVRSNTDKLISLYRTLRICADIAEDAQIMLLLEPVYCEAGSFLCHTETAAEIIRQVDSPCVRLLYDIYHMQRSEGDLCTTIERYANLFGHVHVADVPERHEPGTGEINFHKVFSRLIASGYKERLGFECYPAADTRTAVKGIMGY